MEYLIGAVLGVGTTTVVVVVVVVVVGHHAGRITSSAALGDRTEGKAIAYRSELMVED